MLNRFFKKKEAELAPLNFSIIETDIHSHLIPGIDDGSPDMDTSISIIKKMRELGYKKIITSPHVMSDFYKNTNNTIINGLNNVREELKSQNINMDIDAAAEYYIDFDFEQKIGKEKFLTFGNNYILVEISFMQEPNNLFQTIFKLQMEGYNVVLAHPERYGYYNEEDYDNLISRGVFFQINLLSLIGYYSPQIKQKTKKLITKNQVSLVGTDCHNMNHAELYKKCQTKKDWHDLVNSGKLLNATL